MNYGKNSNAPEAFPPLSMNTSQLTLGYGKVTSQSVIYVILEKKCLALSDAANISVSSHISDMAPML